MVVPTIVLMTPTITNFINVLSVNSPILSFNDINMLMINYPNTVVLLFVQCFQS